MICAFVFAFAKIRLSHDATQSFVGGMDQQTVKTPVTLGGRKHSSLCWLYNTEADLVLNKTGLVIKH